MNRSEVVRQTCTAIEWKDPVYFRRDVKRDRRTNEAFITSIEYRQRFGQLLDGQKQLRRKSRIRSLAPSLLSQTVT
jgi:hypothetical protein